jgi:D-lactate dehydrogenase
MKIAVFDTHRFDRQPLLDANARHSFELAFFETLLNPDTARLAEGFDVVCPFVNDQLNRATLEQLHALNVGLIALRCAGFNNVDIQVCGQLGIKVVRVPEYSPYAVAEHALALIMALNRKTHRAYDRVREGNFSLDGLVGFDLHGKTVGLLGTGRIGRILARILHGFGCRILASDLYQDSKLIHELGVEYVDHPMLFQQSDILSLHVPLTPDTHHLIDEKAIQQMKRGIMLINTSRGALIDTRALILGLKRGWIGAAGLDVYEEEEAVFFRDLSGEVLMDDILARLLTFSNVIITSHQAFLTREALDNIARTTLENIQAYAQHLPLVNEVKPLPA